MDEQAFGLLDYVRDHPILSAGAGLAALVLLALLLTKGGLFSGRGTKPAAGAGDRLEVQGGWMTPHFGAGSAEGTAAAKTGGDGHISAEVSRIDQSVARARLDLERLSSDVRALRSSQKAELGKAGMRISALKDELAALSASFADFSAKRGEAEGAGPGFSGAGPRLSAEIASIVRDLHQE